MALPGSTMKSTVFATIALVVSASSAYAQNDSLPEPSWRGIAVLAGGGTCNTQGDCFFQYGLRLAGLKPGHFSPDVAFLAGTGVLMDLSLAHADRLSRGLYFAPRFGVSIGEFRALSLNVGAGLVAVFWERLAVRLDFTYRNLWIGEFGVATGSGLGSLTLGVGTTTAPPKQSGGTQGG